MPTCPKDAEPLILRASAHAKRWQCGVCAGAFLENLAIKGSLLPAVVDESRRVLTCPQDASAMRLVRSKDVTFRICLQCNGVWLTGMQVRQILKADPAANTESEFLPGIELFRYRNDAIDDLLDLL